MIRKPHLSAAAVSVAALAFTCAPALAQNNHNDHNQGGSHANAGASVNAGTPAQLAYSAAGVLRGQMQKPAQERIPQSLINGAHCIGVFPSVFKEGFLVAGKNGDGVVACRDKSGNWDHTAPTFYSLSGGSVGFQAGAKVTKVIVLFMGNNAIKDLTNGNIKIGAKASATAGPAGAHASVHTAPAQIITYRLSSSGGFAGAAIKGATLSRNQDIDKAIYGAKKAHGKPFQPTQVPQTINAFTNALSRFAPASKYNASMVVKGQNGQGANAGNSSNGSS
ncbi:lipid-binding SYLF domain-containing protein [Salinisphaera sp. RV14]|uniref:lipid-binding SYLF domain-containing protein n=1 Tax=Salinisphaera sp. RV14 TaxID=3454140 RepID=UPI003F868367